MLWCNLRSTSDLLLQKVCEIFHYSNSTLCCSENGNENERTKNVDITSSLPSNNYSLYTKEEFSVFDINITENNLNSSFIAPPEFEKKIVTQKLDPQFNFLTLIESSLFTKINVVNENFVARNNDSNNKSLLIWLRNWLNDETKFCQNCINNTDSWNYGISRQMSLRYYAFILSKVIKYLLNCEIFKCENSKLEGTSDYRKLLSDIQDALTRTTGQLLEEGD